MCKLQSGHLSSDSGLLTDRLRGPVFVACPSLLPPALLPVLCPGSRICSCTLSSSVLPRASCFTFCSPVYLLFVFCRLLPHHHHPALSLLFTGNTKLLLSVLSHAGLSSFAASSSQKVVSSSSCSLLSFRSRLLSSPAPLNADPQMLPQ